MLRYLIEIKNRLTLVVFTTISTFIVSYLYKETLLLFCISSITFNGNTAESYFIYTDVSEVFYVYMSLTLFVTSQVFILCLCYHIFLFLSPAMFYLEYSVSRFSFKILLFVWVLSVFTFKFLIVPITWDFFLSFQGKSDVSYLKLYFESKLSEYFYFFVSLYYACVFYYQLFAFLFLILYFRSVSSTVIKKFRKIYYFIFVVFSTLVSPPDVITQTSLSLLTILLFEISVFGFFVGKSLIKVTS